jgi:hypothetical protein
MDLKQVAWNGIRFMAPTRWEAGQIGRQYLLLGNDSGPVLEVKWHRIKGKFSHRAQLKRLARQGRGKKGRTIKESPLPGEWERALEKYQAMGFDWQGPSVGGKGVILYCRECRTATLLQFYLAGRNPRESEEAMKVSAPLLSSFQDHAENTPQLYAIYDIKAVIPENFQLSYFRFTSGEFELRFKCKRQSVTLYRWGLASILLQNSDLARFAGKRIHLPEDTPEVVGPPGGAAIEWQWVEDSGRRSWWRNIIASPFLRKLRIWHLEKEDRILGVSMEGKAIADFRLYEQICADYETV